MKARIEKKLSKKLIEIAPKLFRGAWVYKDEPSELAYKQGTRVSNVWMLGGGVDYWGEGCDSFTVWQSFKQSWFWLDNFPKYPEGDPKEFFPNTDGFSPTTRNLLRLAREQV